MILKKTMGGTDKMETRISKKDRIFDKDKLLEKQKEIEKKYGLRPHKQLRLSFIWGLPHIKNDELLTQESGGMYQ
jgi:hypothetical protein